MRIFYITFRLFMIFLAMYILVLFALYLSQERLIFFGEKLPNDYTFSFQSGFDEIDIKNEDEVINGVVFYAKDEKKPKGAVLFLHGNSGSVQSWGDFGDIFVDLGYNFYIFDYASFGKSSGKIDDESDLLNQSDLMIKRVLQDFQNSKIIIIGHSLGSGLAARLASLYNPKELILIAPYFKFDELAIAKIPYVPKFLVKYKIPTATFIKEVKNTKITIFHGTNDEVIDIENSHKLSKILKSNDVFFSIAGGHNLLWNDDFISIITQKIRQDSIANQKI